MPQVPLLSPEASPSPQGTPSVNLPVPVEAFGGAVGAALSHLGETVSGAGDKIWQRAVELQNLKNETEVDKADAAYMEKAGILHADFSAKQGTDAQQAFPQYIKDLQAAREGIKGGLSNPMSQKMFDRTSLSTYGRTVFNGAGHAATQAKVANIDATTQRLKTTIDQAGTTDDPAQFEGLRKKALALNDVLHNQKGLPDSAADSARVINSSLDTNKVIYQAKVDPIKAAEDLASLRKNKRITDEDYQTADRFITSQRRAIGSANIANEVYAQGSGEDGKPELSEDAMVELGKKAAADAAPDDPILAQHVENAIHTKYTRSKQSARQFTWDNKQQISLAMQNGATSVQELLADPKTASAYHSLDPKEQNAIPGILNRFIKARDYADNQRSMTTLKGLSQNDVLQFLDTDPTDPKWKLSQSQVRTVMGWSNELRKNQNQDPQVNRAMSWLRGSIGSQLQALSIYHRNAKDPNDYDNFTGALSEALGAWQTSHGKPAESKDVTETIAPQLLKTHQTQGMFWGAFGAGTSDPLFKDVLSSDHYKKFADEHAKSRTDSGQPAPTEAETQRLYYRGLAKTLYKSGSP